MNVGISKALKLNLSLKSVAVIIGSLFFAAEASAMTAIESTFDPGTGPDGWTAVVCGNPGCPLGAETGALAFDTAKFGRDLVDPQPFESGDGHLFMVDPGSDETGMYEAPAAFADALSGPGAVLEIDIFVDSGSDGSYDTSETAGLVPLFYIESGAAGGGVVYLLPVASITLDTWHSFDIPMAPSGGPGTWFAFGGGLPGPSEDVTGAALTAALSGGDGDRALRIWGELTNDTADEDGTSLDNVRITVVPIPAALPMMLSALAAFGLWRRKSA